MKFLSTEYWEINIWDRDLETNYQSSFITEKLINEENFVIEMLREKVDQATDNIIADCPSGTGIIGTRIINEIPAKCIVHFLDVNKAALNIAKERLGKKIRANCEAIDIFRAGDTFNSKFNFVVCIDFFHHVPDIDRLVEILYSLLKPGGYLIGNVFAKEKYCDWEIKKYGFLKMIFRRATNFLIGRMYRYFGKGLKKEVRRSGIMRLEPVARKTLEKSLNEVFKDVEIFSNYYHRFVARK